MTSPTVPRYAVVGAGASGLSAARVFVRDGIPFDVFERHSAVGGLWAIDNPGTPVYETAHFISSKNRSALAGFPFPEHYPDYPSREQVLAYLRDFAEGHDLARHVEFDTAVKAIEPVDGERAWDVRLDTGETRRYAGVVMGSGNFWTPNLPSYPGSFTGEAYHARDYTYPEQFAGRRVLVVGAGNTGCDIVCDAAQHADAAVLSMRRGYRFVPKWIFGMPALDFARTGPNLPGRVEQFLFDKLLDLVVGDLSGYGVPEPDHPVLASHPILNTRIVDHLVHGQVAAKPDVAEVRGDRVRFADGTVEAFDTIVWATGYRASFPYLDDRHISWSGQNPNLFLNVFHRRYDRLFAVGVLEVDAGAFPIISLQTELIGQVVRDLADDPAQASVFRRVKQTNPDLSGGIRHVDSGRHDYYVRDVAYRRYATGLLERMRAGELTTAGVPVRAHHRLVDRLRRVAGALSAAAGRGDRSSGSGRMRRSSKRQR